MVTELKEKSKGLKFSDQKRYQIWKIIKSEGRSLVWLASRIEFTVDHIKHVKMGERVASAAFRNACEEALGIDESILFSCPNVK
jgi:hypothetical protein